MVPAMNTTIDAMWGIASDETEVFVEIDEYGNADESERDNPDFWLEQLAWNKAVWTE